MTIERLIDDMSPDMRQLLSTIAKVCDFPDRDEKWALLKTLNEILVFAAYPAFVVPVEQKASV